MRKKVAILGGAGNGEVVANAIVHATRSGDDQWEFAGFLNDRVEKGGEIGSFPVLGGIEDARAIAREGTFLINTIHRIDGQQERIDLFERLGVDDERMATFVHPSAYVAPEIELGPGVVLLPNVSLSPGIRFGVSTLIMVGVTIAHDTIFSGHCTVAAQACIGARLQIADGVHIGLNATLREDLSIGKNATIGMGSVLTHNVGENEIWVGNPARFLRMAT